jgi:hypothetical protein
MGNDVVPNESTYIISYALLSPSSFYYTQIALQRSKTTRHSISISISVPVLFQQKPPSHETGTASSYFLTATLPTNRKPSPPLLNTQIPRPFQKANIMGWLRYFVHKRISLRRYEKSALAVPKSILKTNPLPFSLIAFHTTMSSLLFQKEKRVAQMPAAYGLSPLFWKDKRKN